MIVGPTEPHCATEQVTLHVTLPVPGSLLTVAMNCPVAPAITVRVLGATVTVIAGTVTVIVPFFVLSATEVTVMVTVKSLVGASAGAV